MADYHVAVGQGKDRTQLRLNEAQLFRILQLAWNMRECCRLLTPGTSERQFTMDDPRWIADTNKHCDDAFKDIGFSLQKARQLFAPDNCPDLMVPHVVFETDYSAEFQKSKREQWLVDLEQLAVRDLAACYTTYSTRQRLLTVRLYQEAFADLTAPRRRMLLALKPNERWWRALQADEFGPQLG